MADWTGEPLSVAEEVLLASLQSQREGLLAKFADSEPTFESLLALRSEAIVIRQMIKDVTTEINRHRRPGRMYK